MRKCIDTTVADQGKGPEPDAHERPAQAPAKPTDAQIDAAALVAPLAPEPDPSPAPATAGPASGDAGPEPRRAKSKPASKE